MEKGTFMIGWLEPEDGQSSTVVQDGSAQKTGVLQRLVRNNPDKTLIVKLYWHDLIRLAP